jgi:CBS domain-containing protein
VAAVLAPSDDLITAVDRLRTRGVYAVIVAEGNTPVGILTGRDMTLFFRSLFDGLLMVEQIEITLKHCLESTFPSPEARLQAMFAAFGPNPDDQQRPARGEKYLSFSDLLILISDSDNWPSFESRLGPKVLFDELLDRVRHVRNELAHFQSRPDALDLDILRRTMLWLSNQLAAQAGGAATLPELELHRLSQVLAQRKPPVCTTRNASIGEALKTMTANRYGQLPVLDEEGRLCGLISQQGIAGLYFHTNGKASLLKAPVHHALEAAKTLTPEDDLFKAVEALAAPRTNAVLVVEEGRPAGLLTGKDMTHFFRSLFEGIILAEEIEVILRDYTRKAFPNEAALNAAAMAAFGPGPNQPSLPRRNPHKLSFGDRLQMLCASPNWDRFEAVLGPQNIFLSLMGRAREVRNALMHFRGQLDAVEFDALTRAYTWLQTRPPWPESPDSQPVTPHAPRDTQPDTRNTHSATPNLQHPKEDS